jgi:hypothetical protein
MDNRPLDYASPHGVRIKGAPTPEQIRFRRRMRMGLLIAFILGLIPYPTQVLPAVKIQLIDPTGKPVTDVVSLRWHGYNNKETLDGHLQFDMSAKAEIPSQRIWSSPFGRIMNYMSGILPHSGGFGSTTSGGFEFYVPADYTLNAKSMGLIQDKFWSGSYADKWRFPKTKDELNFIYATPTSSQRIYLEIAEPDKWTAAARQIKIILEHNSGSTTNPAS